MSRSFAVVLAVIVLGLAAVVVPSLRRARSSPGEQGGLGDILSLMAAERSYAQLNGGYFDEPSCLADPGRCLPDHPPGVPAFLDPAFARLTPRLGYSFVFHKGPPPQLGPDDRARHSPSSLASYAVVARPAEQGGALKAFCGDSTGRTCVRRDGRMTDVQQGRCPDDCETLR